MTTAAATYAAGRGTRLARLAAAARTEVGLFRLGLGAIALHVADDNFFQPNPGTSAGDHAAGGLAQLAVLGLALAVYHRVRAGARAALALAYGLFGLIVSVEAVYDSLKGGPAGDDYTGLLAIPAGVAMLALGTAALWRSRRRDGRRSWRYARRGLRAVAGVAVLNFVMFPVALGYFTTHIHRADVPVADLGAPHEDVSFETSDGLRLRGWYVPSRNGAAVIAFPGRNGPQKHARVLARHGYGVLLFDRRGEGESEGDGNVFGWGGEKDILAAVDYLRTRPDVDPSRIGGIGFSVGGEMMLQAAAESDELAAVVSEGAGTRWLAEEIDELDTVDDRFKWLAVPQYVVKTAAVAAFSSTAPPPKLNDLVREIDQPLFLIWAPNGGNLETMNPVYYRLAPSERKQIWEIPDARHVRGLDAHPAEYERRVVGFFDQALLTNRSHR